MSDVRDYDYDLPRDLIAQQPLPSRSDSRMLVVDRNVGRLEHAHVRDLPDFLSPGDSLVLNNSRVVPARLIGRRVVTKGRWQGLFLGANEQGHWRLLCKTRGKLKPGDVIQVFDRDAKPALKLKMLTRLDAGEWAASVDRTSDAQNGAQVESTSPETVPQESVWDTLQRVGRVPLPPYIRGGEMVPDDEARYQTVYAESPGSVAAPTAGLHLTKPLLDRLQTGGIDSYCVTLHVGVGTFRPIGVDRLADHTMHFETGELTSQVVQRLQQTREAGGRIVAVGTTSVRVLESAAASGELKPWSGETDLFIRPPYTFRAVDGLLTNFHLPRSTLLVLVRAFGGDELMRRAYQEAIGQRYRFFSYGDAMLIL